MGKLYNSIFGGSSSKNSAESKSFSQSQSKNASWNDAFPYFQESFKPVVQSSLDTNDFVKRLLGVGGDPTVQQNAFNSFLKNTGYDFQQKEAAKAVAGNAAGSGIYKSGAAMKALADRSQGIAESNFGNYLQMLLGLGNQGLSFAQLLGSTGAKSYGDSSSTSESSSWSKGKSSSKNGLGGLVGSILGGGAK